MRGCEEAYDSRMNMKNGARHLANTPSKINKKQRRTRINKGAHHNHTYSHALTSSPISWPVVRPLSCSRTGRRSLSPSPAPTSHPAVCTRQRGPPTPSPPFRRARNTKPRCLRAHSPPTLVRSPTRIRPDFPAAPGPVSSPSCLYPPPASVWPCWPPATSADAARPARIGS